MPQAVLTVDQEVERGLYQIWHIGRRHELIICSTPTVAALQSAYCLGNKVVPIPRTEKRSRPDHQRVGGQFQNAALRFELASSIRVQRARLIAFDIGAGLAPIEYEVARKA